MVVVCMLFLSASHKGTIDQCLLSRCFVRSGSPLRSCAHPPSLSRCCVQWHAKAMCSHYARMCLWDV